MPLFQAERCRALSAECRQWALAAESKLEKTYLINLALSWNRLANQTDRYAEFLKNARNTEGEALARPKKAAGKNCSRSM
jgi:hypothetical protein